MLVRRRRLREPTICSRLDLTGKGTAMTQLAGIEQSIAEIEMQITMERALMQRIPDANVENPMLVALQDILRRRMALRRAIHEVVTRRERVGDARVALNQSYQVLREASALLRR